MYHISLGDSGYPLREWLMTPILNPRDERERQYNVAHKGTRRIVENAFGMLKRKFPCLKYLRLSPTKAARVVIACATLHNVNLNFTNEDDMVAEVNGDDGEPAGFIPQLENRNDIALRRLGRQRQLQILNEINE